MNTVFMMMGGGENASGMQTIIMLVLMIGVFYFFMIRPQLKKQKELKTFREALKPGDKIVTIGGVHGTIKAMQDTTLTIKVEDGSVIKIERTAIITDFAAHQQQNGRK